MSGSFRIGSLFGIPLSVHYTWFAVFALITVQLGFLFGEPGNYPQWNFIERWGMALATSLLFFASVVVHELSHSLVALRRGIPVLGITLFIFGGVSQLSREATQPRWEAAIAAAGPLTSLALSALFFAIAFVVGSAETHVEGAAMLLGIINLALAVFNMLPGFPMDGGRVLRAVVWSVTRSYSRATRVAASTGRLVGLGIAAAGVLLFLLQGDVGALWLVFVGLFLESAARSSYRHQRAEDWSGGG